MKYVLEVLFPYFFLLYALDCITIIKAHDVLFTSWCGQKFNLKRSGAQLIGLLPTSQAIIAHNLPIHCTRDGIYLLLDDSSQNKRIGRAEDFSFIKFQEIDSIEAEGKNLNINNRYIFKTPSISSARFNARLFGELKLLSPPDRRQKIKRHLSDAYDLNAIKKIQACSSKYFAIIKILSAYLFVLVFLILPLSLYSDLADYVHLNAFVICMLLSYSLLLAAAFLALKKLFRSDTDHRTYTLLSIIFSPVNAIHILSYLTKNLFSQFNHLTVAAYFLRRDDFKELAGKEIYLIDYFEKEIERQDWREYWRLKRELLLGLLAKLKISLVEISTAPEKNDQTAVCYCPVCRTEYRHKLSICVDCAVGLREYGGD